MERVFNIARNVAPFRCGLDVQGVGYCLDTHQSLDIALGNILLRSVSGLIASDVQHYVPIQPTRLAYPVCRQAGGLTPSRLAPHRHRPTRIIGKRLFGGEGGGDYTNVNPVGNGVNDRDNEEQSRPLKGAKMP